MNEVDPLSIPHESDTGEVIKDIDELVDQYKALRDEVQRLWIEYSQIANPDLSMGDWEDFGDRTEDREHAYQMHEEANERLVRFEQDHPDAVTEYKQWRANQSKLLARIHHPYDVGSSDEEQ